MYGMTLVPNPAARGCSGYQPTSRIQKTPTLPMMLAMLAVCFLAFLLPASAQQNNTINTVAGGASYSSVALQTLIPNPTAIAEDSSGNIYIASQYSYYVYEVNPSTGALSVVAGSGIFGPSNGGDGGPATSATLSSVVAVAVDKSGNVYIVDGNRIRLVNTQTSAITVLGVTIQPGDISTVAGTGANCPDAGVDYPSCGDTQPAGQATFYAPQGIYIDGSGNLFIADSTDQEIRFINVGSSAVTVLGVSVGQGDIVTVAGNGYICNTPGTVCGDGGPESVPKEAQTGTGNYHKDLGQDMGGRPWENSPSARYRSRR